MDDKYYDSIARSYNELHGEEQLEKLRTVCSNVALKKKAIIADIGGGTGLSAQVFKDQKIIVIEPAKELREQCNCEAKEGTFESIPLHDHSADLVLIVSAIHHANPLEKAIAEIKRVGKGLYAITVLKKSPKHDVIVKSLKKEFIIEKTLDTQWDDIYILRDKQKTKK